MSASLSNVRDLVRKRTSPRTRLNAFEPGGDNVVAVHPARNLRIETAPPKAAIQPQGKIISVAIELETGNAGRIYRGLAKDDIVQDETVRGLVRACEKHDDAWITLMREGRRPSGPVYADILEAQVDGRHVEPFREKVSKVPGVRNTFVLRS